MSFIVVILQLESGSNSDRSYEAESSDADDSDADEHWVPNEKKMKRRGMPTMPDTAGMHRSPLQMEKDIHSGWPLHNLYSNCSIHSCEHVEQCNVYRLPHRRIVKYKTIVTCFYKHSKQFRSKTSTCGTTKNEK